MTILPRILRRSNHHVLLWGTLPVFFAFAPVTLPRQQPTVPDPTRHEKRLAVAVLRFEDRTGDPNLAHWRYSASALLGDQFRRVRQVRLLSEQAVGYGFRRVGLSAGDRVDPNDARKIGEFIEAQRVISGAYSQSGDKWHVEVSVMNVPTGRVSRLHGVTGSDWFDLGSSLCEQILTEFDIAPSDEEKAQMAKRWTTSPEALDWYGKAYMSQAQSEPVPEQQRYLGRAVAADPNCARALAALAATLASEGKLGEAEDAVRKALQIDEDLASGHAVLAQLLLFQKRSEEATEQLLEACRLDPDDARCPAILAQISATEGKWDQAIALLEAAVSRDRIDANIHASLASMYASQGQRDQAMREIEEVEQLDCQGLDAVNVEQTVGSAYERLDEKPEAITHYERLVALARKLDVNPAALIMFEQKIEYLKTALTPTFLDVPMPERCTAKALDKTIRNRLGEEESSLAVNPLTWNDEMKSWAEELTKNDAGDLEKAKAIFDALAKRAGAQGLPSARTAQEVFAVWSNTEVPLRCGDHAVLFVALARAVDVNAFFVYVSKDPQGKLLHHGCAAVFEDGRALLVDPAWHWFGVPHSEFKVMDDLKTIALFCSMNAEPETQLACRRLGLKLCPDSLFGRLSLTGAVLDAKQFQETQDMLAEIPAPQTESWNTYCFHSLHGALALARGDLETSSENMQKALSIYPRGDTRYLLGMVLEQQGQLRQAREEYRHALRSGLQPDTAEFVRRRIGQINDRVGFEAAERESPPVEAR